jgi:hypothetical protein
MQTTPDVFIVESLRFKDEEAGYPEGHFISHVLRLADRNVRYFYIRTRKEFEAVLHQFQESNFRYLHLSCHANESGIALTLDDLSIEELARLLRPVIDKKRVFLSACKLATPELATALMKGSKCYSIVGPSKVIDVDESALFWASVYHIMFRNEVTSMQHKKLQTTVCKASSLFGVSMRFFSRDSSSEHGWQEIDVRA